MYLKGLFEEKYRAAVERYNGLITHHFNDEDVNALIEHFRDKDLRKALFREYKDLEMLYEIISPDAFLRPYIDGYTTLSAIYSVVNRAYTRRVYADREFQRKTAQIVHQHVDLRHIDFDSRLVAIDNESLAHLKGRDGKDGTSIINLVKSINRAADEDHNDPFLISLSDRAQKVMERFEERQSTTEDALKQLTELFEENTRRKSFQANKGLDSLTYFVYSLLVDMGVPEADAASREIGDSFRKHVAWKHSEPVLRELRQQVSKAQEFKRRVKMWGKKLGVEVRGIVLRSMHNKWASSSSHGRLIFNLELLELNVNTGDYVIIHELLHALVPNHGRLFKVLIMANYGDDSEAVAELQSAARNTWRTKNTSCDPMLDSYEKST